MKLLKFVEGLKFKSTGKADIGILKVAFMVAALDGEVSVAEYETFERMAARIGSTPESTRAALAEAMHSAGYLLLLSKRVTVEGLVKAFMTEASEALPSGFAALPTEDVRRAIVMWIAMGMSDGDYSDRERRCIETICRHFAELKVMRTAQSQEVLMSPGSVFGQAFDMGGIFAGNAERGGVGFLDKVERLIAEFNDSEAAGQELEALLK